MSMVWRPSPRVKIMAWFWFSGFPSPSIAFPGSFILYISYAAKDENMTGKQVYPHLAPRDQEIHSF